MEDIPLQRKRSAGAASTDALPSFRKLRQDQLTQRSFWNAEGWEVWSSKSSNTGNLEARGPRSEPANLELPTGQSSPARDSSADSDVESQDSAITELSTGEDIAKHRERSTDSRSRSRSPHGKLGSKQHAASGVENGKQLLDKFLTGVRHGKPPGHWENAAVKS